MTKSLDALSTDDKAVRLCLAVANGPRERTKRGEVSRTSLAAKGAGGRGRREGTNRRGPQPNKEVGACRYE